MVGRDAQNARTRIWTRGSQTVVAFVHAARKRRRTIAIATAALIVVGCAVAFGAFRYMKAEAAAAVVKGYASLSQCLLGPPLAEGERASLRFRAIQLTALTQSDLTRNAKDAPPWPDRCARHAHILHEGVGASAIADSEDGKSLHRAATELAAALEKKDTHFSDHSAQVDALFDAAAKAGLQLTDAADVPAPPAPSKALTVDGLTAALTEQRIDLAAIGTPTMAGDTVEIVVADSKAAKAPFYCTIKPGKASCRSVAKPAATDGPLRMLGTADGAPLLFGKGAVYTSADGKVVSDSPAQGGHVAADGIVHLLRSDGRASSWSRIEAGRERKSPIFLAGMTIADPGRDMRMFGEHVVILAEKKDGKPLMAARIEATRLSRALEIGALPADFAGLEERRVTACRSGRNDVVRIAGMNQSYLTFWLGSSWSAPVKAMPGEVSFGCRNGAASLHRYRSNNDAQLNSKLEVDNCDAKACQRSALSVRDMLAGELGLAPAGNMAIAALGDASAVAWLAGQRAGLRLRVAERKALSSAVDTIAFDDLVADGKVQSVSTVADYRLLSGANYAVLLLSTTKGLRALTVDAKGRVEPVAIEWQ